MRLGRFNKKHSVDTEALDRADTVFFNLSEAALIQKAVERGEGTLGRGGILLVATGKHTGRSPQDKYVVVNSESENEIWWKKNGRMLPKNFNRLHEDILYHMSKHQYFVQDLYACASVENRLNVRVINELAWHGLFIRHLLRRPEVWEIGDFVPEFTIINCPSFKADPERYEVRSETVIAINLEKKLVIVCGTEYAGENKKAVFTLLNYLLPKKGVLPMHCSVNHKIEEPNELAIFFGLSGTGKTTLSQDPQRTLIGDDEHGWSDDGVFNFEGGCYAKTINLSAEAEPEIYATMSKFSTVVENMTYDPISLELNYEDDSLTPNMRAAYPLNFITNTSETGCGGAPKHIILLTCDAFGVFPPLAKLSPEQAIYHFLSGFTSKTPGTEQGVTEPEPTFSPCYAAPFLPLPPTVYSNILREKIAKYQTKCWLVNTGWTGGPFGIGKRMPIKYTRSILKAILDTALNETDFFSDKHFGFQVPISIPFIDSTLLNPRDTWQEKDSYDSQAAKLIKMFSKNFDQYKDMVDKTIRSVAL